ncbi:MAG: hypothetical protein LBT30_03220 [Clostridiales bacterium]|jgi:hypothetical protein|nr:hypothetical protein [Clostridiales bacterium]
MPVIKKLLILKDSRGAAAGSVKIASWGNEAEIRLEYPHPLKNAELLVKYGNSFKELVLQENKINVLRLKNAPNLSADVSVAIFEDGLCSAYAGLCGVWELKDRHAKGKACDGFKGIQEPSVPYTEARREVYRQKDIAMETEKKESLPDERLEADINEKSAESYVKTSLKDEIREQLDEGIFGKLDGYLDGYLETPDGFERLESKIKEIIKRKGGRELPQGMTAACQTPTEEIAEADGQEPAVLSEIDGQESAEEDDGILSEQTVLSKADGKEEAVLPAVDKAEKGSADTVFLEGVIDAAAAVGNKRQGGSFYENIKTHLDGMLSLYPEETRLNKLILNGKFVRINYDAENYYVVGVYRKDGQARYICYGIPGEFAVKPAGRLKEISRWFPSDFNCAYKSGYWLIFQKAEDGEISLPK